MPRFWQAVTALARALDDPRAEPHLAARGRSIHLLESNLSPEQRHQWARHRYFDVIGGDTGRRYRVYKGCTLNIAQLNGSGGRARLLCFEPQGTLPVGDVMLAQKFALELFESETLAVANKSPGWRSR